MFRPIISINHTIPSMFLQPNQPYLKRDSKTSEPRFKRLQRIRSPQPLSTTLHDFKLKPNNNKNYALDNSKENLFYESHLSKVRSACKLDQATIVSKYLGTIRKDYDDLNKMSRLQLANTRLKRRQIEFMKQKNQVFCDKREELTVKIQEKEKQTQEIRGKEEDAKMQTKTLENIIVRMKKDQIFYKQFGRIRDEQLKKKMKQVKLLEDKLIHEEQKLHKLNINLEQCKGMYDKNKQIRQKKFEDFSGKISDVRERDRFIQQRKERTYELQSIELNDTLDEKNIHMREITLAHKVADSLLESKVNTLIKKNADIQGAFHLVKVKTGVSEPQFLTNKFFSYEQQSESLLASISENEAYIEELKSRKQQLTEQHRQLMNEKLLLNDEQIDSLSQQHFLQQKERLISDINKNELLINSIKNWIGRANKQMKTEAKDKGLDSKFQTMCSNLREQLKKYENFNWAEQKVAIMGVCMKKMIRQSSAEELSIRLRESQQMTDSNLVEEEFIKTSRQVIHKKAFTIKQISRKEHRD